MVSRNTLAICIIAAHPLSSLTTLSDAAQPRLKPALSLAIILSFPKGPGPDFADTSPLRSPVHISSIYYV